MSSPTELSSREAEAVAAISLMAAMADGVKSDEERAHVKRVLASAGGDDLAAVYERVLLKQTNLQAEAAHLLNQETRTMAYEMAVMVADADGATTDVERKFLAQAAQALQVSASTRDAVISQADAIASAPLEEAASVSAASVPAGPKLPAAPTVHPTAAQADSTTVKYAIITAGLELLPENMATLAIIPLQCRMVYAIGSLHGHKLSSAHIKEFIATVGVGLTGQVLEGYARKFLGGLLKKAGGGLLGGLGKAAVGPAMTFATTYALGKVAQAYYAGGRTMSVATLKAAFSQQVETAKGLYEQYRPQVEQSARSTNVSSLLSSVMGRSNP